MDFNKKRELARDSYFYSELRNALQAYCTKHNLGRYDVHFSNVLGYTSKTSANQFSSSVQDLDYRKFSVDELRILVDELKTDSVPFLNRFLSNSGLEVIVSSSSSYPSKLNLNDCAIDGISAMGLFFDSVKKSFSDDLLSKDEKRELLSKFDDLHSFLISLGITLTNVINDDFINNAKVL